MNVNLSISTLAAAVLLFGCNEPEVVMNDAPLADAGDSITQPADQVVRLDGRASYDKNGDALEYHWTFDHLPPTSALGDKVSPFSVNHTQEGATTFQPDTVGTYIVKLEVYDGSLYSDASYVVVNATEPEDAPVAEAGANLAVELGAAVTLDGSQSTDPLGGMLTYQWALVEVPQNSTLTQSDLSGADTISASFTGDVVGSYTATLVVDNGLSSSAPDSIRIDITGDNNPPTADAGVDFTGMDCEDVALDCSASSDPEGDTLSYWWVLQSKPDNSAIDNRYLSSQHVANPTFWADVAGVYEFSCSVFDGTSWSYADTVTINLDERNYNTPPNINAGPDQDIEAPDVDCESTTMTTWPYSTVWNCDSCEEQTTTIGISTSDDDNDPYTLEWIIDEDTRGATLIGADRVPATVVLSPKNPTRGSTCVDRDYDFTLAATDCTGARTEDDVSITVECCGVER